MTGRRAETRLITERPDDSLPQLRGAPPIHFRQWRGWQPPSRECLRGPVTPHPKIGLQKGTSSNDLVEQSNTRLRGRTVRMYYSNPHAQPKRDYGSRHPSEQ